MNLNQGQLMALDALGQFLVGPDKYFTLEGAGGMGKTTVISQFEEDLDSINETLELFGLPKKQQLIFCASTNKAAALFGNAVTIHKVLRLKPVPDYRTGRPRLEQQENVFLQDTVLVIDEASMLGPELITYLEMSTADTCKIIYLLDHCQLAPINHPTPLVHGFGYPSAVLTEPMRQDANSHLYQQCLSFRSGVMEQSMITPVAGEGVRIVDSATFTTEMVEAFRRGENVRVLAYENVAVERLNRFIRHKLNGDTLIRVGDILTMATAKDGSRFTVEGVYKVMHIAPGIPWGKMKTLSVTLQSKRGRTEVHSLPVDKDEYFSILSELQHQGRKEGNWKPYYSFLGAVSDFRDIYACTVHKSQGSTYDRVFIDMFDLKACKDRNTYVRLCYVAISRARKEAIYYTGE